MSKVLREDLRQKTEDLKAKDLRRKTEDLKEKIKQW